MSRPSRFPRPVMLRLPEGYPERLEVVIREGEATISDVLRVGADMVLAARETPRPRQEPSRE